MPEQQQQCEATAHDGATRCADPDPQHRGNHRSDAGDEWANDRDF